MLVTIIILSILIIVLGITTRNLMIKVEKYEDVVRDQTSYLQNISKSVTEGEKHLRELDEKGIFASDDEVGYFFNKMKEIQQELNRYMLPENYGKKEEQS